ncbi:MAG: ABC transporter ATP-binding protein [Acidimicrobiia bacterium]|nr:ABC transporter ATP-binding protein [Acidimicrobiia bacterium]
MPAIEVEDLCKRYADNRAVDGLSFTVEPGEVYALLGENGAGKTTTVEILEGLRPPTSGRVRVLDVDPAIGGREFRDRIGIVLQSSGVESEFTVREVIELYASAYRQRRGVSELVDLVGLEDKVDDRVGSLSGGQKRRIDLALGLVGTPELLFLDEPTTGFDPAARRRFWELIESLGADGTTVLLTTHYLDEAEHLADRVGVLSNGRMIAEGSPAQLRERTSGTSISFLAPGSVAHDEIAATFGELLGARPRISGRLVEASVAQPTMVVHRLSGWALDNGVELESLTVSRASLEDVYLGLTAPDGEPPEPPA